VWHVRLNRRVYAIPNGSSLRFGMAGLAFDTGILDAFIFDGEALLFWSGTRIRPAEFHFLIARCSEHFAQSQK
jgi:hypothetical protein